MKRSLVSLAVSFIALIGLCSCKAAAPDTNRTAMQTANSNAAKEKVDPVAIEAEIIKLEKDWAAASQRHDAEGLRRILADDLIMTYPDGTTGNKTGELSDLESGAVTMDAWELTDTKVTVLSADAAFITGRSVIKNGKSRDAKSKSVIDISGEYRFTDIYARRNGQWQAVASQATKIERPAPAR